MPTKVLVSDTNIWIDLHRAGILESVFRLPYEFVVTDFVYRELNEPGAADLTRLGMRVEALEKDGVEALVRLSAELGNTSMADLSCFHLASVNNWTLLTGDKAVRRACRDHAVEVHGVLWLLDRLYDHEVLGGGALAGALEAMLEQGGRLPVGECERRVRRWRGKS